MIIAWSYYLQFNAVKKSASFGTYISTTDAEKEVDFSWSECSPVGSKRFKTWNLILDSYKWGELRLWLGMEEEVDFELDC